MAGQRRTATRRTVLRTGATAAAAGAMGAGGLLFGFSPGVAASVQSWDAGSDETITTSNGTIDAVIVDPSITIEYEHLAPDRQATIRLDVRYAADPEFQEVLGTATGVYESTVSLPGSSGEVTHDVPETTITADPAIDVADFQTDGQRLANTTHVGLTVTVIVEDQYDLDPLSASDSFAVIVEEPNHRTLSETVESPYGAATINRDHWGVPHIEAESEPAAIYAVGYVQAFDRMFPMDLQRRIMRGELAEIAGSGEAGGDEFNRKMDFVGAAEASREALAGTEIEPLLEAFADGVNDSLENEVSALEFQILPDPDPWTVVDTLLMEKNIAWNLTGSFGDLYRANDIDTYGEQLVNEFDPRPIVHDYPIIDSSPAGESTATAQGQSVDPAFLEWVSQHDAPPSYGSNSWIVDGEHTASGTPVLSNDPHLYIMAPPLWYECHLETPELSVRGYMLPGMPAPVIGRTDEAAWGFTSPAVDVADVYTYEFSQDGEQYLYDGEWRDIESEEQEIVVDGAANRTVTVQKTVHGPLIERGGERVALAWPAFSATSSVGGLHDLLYSESADEAFAASRDFGISLALVYATTDETLFTVTGPLPVRRTPDGTAVPGDQVFDGSAAEGEWNGFVPYGETDWDGDGFLDDADIPEARNTGYLVSSNQAIAYDTDHYIGNSGAGPQRAKRIDDEIEATIDAGEPIDLEFARDMMLDIRDERAAAIVPDIVAAAEDSGDPDLEDAATTLDAWDYRMDRDSEAALIFHRWLANFRSSITGSPGDWVAVTLSPDSILFDTEDRETKLLDALTAALADIDANGWSVYGDWNTTRQANHPFGNIVPQLNYPEISVDGSPGTVNNFRPEYNSRFAAGSTFRMAVDLEGSATTMLPGGNSGDPTSEHFVDQFHGFYNGRHRPMGLDIEGPLTTTFVPEGDA